MRGEDIHQIRARLAGRPGVALMGHSIEAVPAGATSPTSVANGVRAVRTNARAELTIPDLVPGDYLVWINITPVR